jgi:hypothetical protein
MKTAHRTARLLTLTLLCSALMTGCTSVPNDATAVTTTRTHVEGVPGGVMSKLTTLVATVEKIDYQAREVALIDAKGNRKTLRISPEAAQLQQVKIGDTVKVEYAEELAVFVKGNGPVASSSANAVAITAPTGQKPPLVVTGSKEQTAIVKALDLEYHTATLRFPDGGERTYLVREDVKLDKSQIGREVVFRQSEALGISVEPR